MIKVIGHIGRDSDVEYRFWHAAKTFQKHRWMLQSRECFYQLSTIDSVNSKQVFFQQLASMAKLQL